VALFVAVAQPGVGEAKIRCERRSCTVIGGMEVTLRSFDKWREGSKLNILKTRRKVEKGGAQVILKNHYFKNDAWIQAADQTVTASGRNAKKVKIVGWDGIPFRNPELGISGDFVCDNGGVCNLRPSGGLDWVGTGGKWDGVVAVAEVTIYGERGYVCAVAGTVPENTRRSMTGVCRNTPAAIEGLEQSGSGPLDPIGPNMAFAWVSEPTKSTSVANSSYSYNPSGESVSIQRFQKGRWRVSFPGWDSEGAFTAQVTAYGTAGAYCASYPYSPSVYVECTNASGQLIDTKFSVLASAVQDDAYAWVSSTGGLMSGFSPQVIPASLDELEDPNVERDYQNIVIYKVGTGAYIVHFVDYAEVVRPFETATVTSTYALNPAGTRCSLGGIYGDYVSVVCHSSAGNRVDASFQVLATGSPTDAYGWSEVPGAALAVSNVDLSNAPERVIEGAENTVLIVRENVGRYQVYFHELSNFSGGGNVQVTEVGSDGERICGVRWWSSDDAYVSCTDSNGSYADSEFTVRYTKSSLAKDH
jgi:hypothetical protein